MGDLGGEESVVKSVSIEQVKSWEPCWLEEEGGLERLEAIGSRKEQWTALDVLDLPPEEVSDGDKLWVVLREELIDGSILHEFGCRCVEEALKLVENPDPRSLAAIEAKRSWLRGEISDDELWKARAKALAAARAAAWYAACAAAWSAARAAAWDAARPAAWDAAWYAASAAASAAARNAARARQVSMLREMLRHG